MDVPLSDLVKSFARDRRTRANAVVALRRETPGLGVADALKVVNAYINTLPVRRRAWVLWRGDAKLADLECDGTARFADLHFEEAACRFGPAFEDVRPRFERLAQLDAKAAAGYVRDEATEPWEQYVYTKEEAADIAEADALWDALREPGLILASPDGRTRFELAGVRFRDGRAWWSLYPNSPRTIAANDDYGY